MKTFLLGGVAAVAIGLGLAASNASAHWEPRAVERWDPYLGAYVITTQQVWVPDPVIATYPPVVVPRPFIGHREYFYGRHEHWRHHDHDGHHEHRHHH